MANPFASRGITNPITMPTSNPQQTQAPQSNPDAVSIAESVLKQSGGDAKAAFYKLAKEKGVDPDQFLTELQSMGDMNSMAQNMMKSDPRIGRLMSLFSMVK